MHRSLHLVWGVCLFTFNKASGRHNSFLCFRAGTARPSPSTLLLLFCQELLFSRGKEVISFPAFVCVWMWATLFQQYSLVSTTLSILTKIYNLSVLYNSRLSHKNRNFLNWFDSPHQISAVFSPSFTQFLPFQNFPCRVIVKWEKTQNICNDE